MLSMMGIVALLVIPRGPAITVPCPRRTGMWRPLVVEHALTAIGVPTDSRPRCCHASMMLS